MRQAGILLHITSLPGPGGIGSLGEEAYKFADFLHEAGMTLWQVLPCGPTGYGESPYQAQSMYAGNPLLISAQKLAEDGLLTLTDEDFAEDENPEMVNWGAVHWRKERMLRRCFAESWDKVKKEVRAFEKANHWVHDFALFTVIKGTFNLVQWTKWPDKALRFREPKALKKIEKQYADELNYHTFVQYLFFKQWYALKNYVNSLGIGFFGDMPIYVAEDSADAWTDPDVFQMDEDRQLRRVGGVPPDYFSEDGQLWGNPLYRWDYLRTRKYDWWVKRMQGMTKMYDLIRVDHFIGFANYWSIAAGAPNARGGHWVPGPGGKLFDRLNKEIPNLQIVAEDLGVVSDRVIKLMEYVGYPGMRTLCFAFDGDETNIHHPLNVKENCVYYTGTHDNDTICAFIKSMSPNSLAAAKKYLKFTGVDDGVKAFVKACFDSKADRALIPMQDALGLDGETRMNLPGTCGSNWHWRLAPGAATPELAAWLHGLLKTAKRLPEQQEETAEK